MSKRKEKLLRLVVVGLGVGLLLGLLDGFAIWSKNSWGWSVVSWWMIGVMGSLMFGGGAVLFSPLLLWLSNKWEWQVESLVVGGGWGAYLWLSYIDRKALVYTEGHWVTGPAKVLEAGGWLVLAVMIGWLIAKGLRNWQISKKMASKGLLGWLVMLVVMGGVVWWAPGERGKLVKEEGGGKNKSLILVTVDTLRADAATEELMPQTVNYFEKGWRREVYTPSSWTAPSFASMWTGKVPTEIGADEEMDEVVNKGEERVFVPKEEETLAERLLSEGYVTQGIVNNFLLNRERGFAQGFEGFDNREDVRDWQWQGANQKVSLVKLWHRTPVLGKWLREAYSRVVGRSFTPWSKDGADLIVKEGVEWLKAREERKGVFLWLHLVDSHDPYEYHEEYGVEAKVEPRKIRSLEHFEDGSKMRLREVDKRAVRQLYEGEVRFADEQLGRLWQYLEESGWNEEAVVVFTSDHGEEFWEHGNLGHVRSYYEETVRVPLMIKGAGKDEIGGELSLVDLKGTILELLKIDNGGLDSWFDEGYGEKTIWLDADGRGPIRKGLREGQWKLIKDVDGNQELYDLEVDKDEQNNVVERFPRVTDQLSKKLNNFYEEKEARSVEVEEGFKSGVFVGY